jgi:hypothetical protein
MEPLPSNWKYTPEQLAKMSDRELVASLCDQIHTEPEGQTERIAQLEAEIERRGLTPDEQCAARPPFHYVFAHGD